MLFEDFWGVSIAWVLSHEKMIVLYSKLRFLLVSLESTILLVRLSAWYESGSQISFKGPLDSLPEHNVTQVNSLWRQVTEIIYV